MTDAYDASPERQIDTAQDAVAGSGQELASLAPSGRPASPRRGRRGRRWLLLFLVVLIAGGGAMTLLTGVVPAKEIPRALAAFPAVKDLPGAIAAIMPAKAPASPDNCVRCHDTRVRGTAALYLGVNGTVPAVNAPVQSRPGDVLELDFHFTGLLGNPQQHQAVGVQVVVPDGPLWRVVPGARGRPKSWGPTGTGQAFWSPAWDNGGNGEGPRYLQWTSSRDAPGRYFLSLVGTPFAVSDLAAHGAVLPDRGKLDLADRDGIESHTGANAIVAVPPDAAPGSYTIEVYGIGHDRDGKRANIARSVQIQVERSDPRGAKPAASVSPAGEGAGVLPQDGRSAFVPATGTRRQSADPAPIQPSGGQSVESAPSRTSAIGIYQANCGGCHGGTPNGDLIRRGEDTAARIIAEGTKASGGKMPAQGQAAGGRLSERDIALIVEELKFRAKYQQQEYFGPPIPHGLQGRENRCSWCHGPDKVVPRGRGHVAANDDECTTCHMVPPKIPHTTMGRDVCSACHTVDPKSR